MKCNLAALSFYLVSSLSFNRDFVKMPYTSRSQLMLLSLFIHTVAAAAAAAVAAAVAVEGALTVLAAFRKRERRVIRECKHKMEKSSTYKPVLLLDHLFSLRHNVILLESQTHRQASMMKE